MVVIESAVQLLVVVMGVSGCGKSSLGMELANRIALGRQPIIFLDADDFHPPANAEKMKNGIVRRIVLNL